MTKLTKSNPRKGWKEAFIKAGREKSQIISDKIDLDQIKTLDRKRFIKKLGHLNEGAVGQVKSTIKEILVS